MRKVTCLIVFIVGIFASAAIAEEIAGLPLHVTRLNDSVVRVWLGDYVSTTAQVAFATSKGIVVVDTVGDPKIDALVRQVIARELGRNDFAILINTHEHADHTGGNAVYDDCLIVGHESIAAALSAPPRDNRQWLEWMKSDIAEHEKKLAGLAADSAEAKKTAEVLVFDKLLVARAQSRPKSVAPQRTFSDHLTLESGDTRFELYAVGGMHSPSDIAIFVPRHGIVLTGDVMADKWLTETPGCLASFGARSGMPHDFPRLLANWDRIFAHKDEIKMMFPGHWNGTLSVAGAQDRVNYVRMLWDSTNAAVKAGRSLPDLQRDLALGTKFPHLTNEPGCTQQNNYMTITEMWKIAAHQESAAEKLYALIDAGAPESEIRGVLAERDRNVSRYFFTEAEINAQGYRLMNEGKLPKAIAMFRINVTLHPDAWNVYDSLGEALLKAGEIAEGKTMYEKSVALNPENQNGKDALARLAAPAKS